MFLKNVLSWPWYHKVLIPYVDKIDGTLQDHSITVDNF